MQANDPKDRRTPIKFFGHQQEFIFSEARNTFLGGGWRSGKSWAALGFAAVSMHANPGCIGGIIEPDYKMLRDFINNKFRPAFAPYITGESKQDNTIFLTRGRKVVYLSGHNIDKLEQYEFGWLLADEAGLMHGDLYMRANARVADPKAGHPRLGFCGTPKMGWLSDTFQGRKDKDRLCIHAKTTDNPSLTDEYIKGLYEAVPSRLADAYINGLFVPLGSLVWPEFGDGHVIDLGFQRQVRMIDGSFSRPVVNIAIDWSPNRPHVLFIQRLPKGAAMPGGWVTKREVSLVVDELHPDGEHKRVTTQRLCEMIKQRKAKDGGSYPIEAAVVDPAGVAREATSGDSNVIQAQKYLDIPILYLPGQRIQVGIQHVQLALEPLGSHPFLFFSSDLKNNIDPCCGYGKQVDNINRSILKSMTGYAYEKDNKGRLLDEPYHDPVFSHAADALRYHVRFYHAVDRLEAEFWKAA